MPHGEVRAGGQPGEALDGSDFAAVSMTDRRLQKRLNVKGVLTC
jgi:hypothetical protein